MAAELPPLLGLRCPHAREDLREHIQPQLDLVPDFRLGSPRRTCPRTSLPCSSCAERRHDDQQTAQGAARAATTSSASSYTFRPDQGYVRGLPCNAAVCGAATRTTRARDKIVTASRLYRLPDRQRRLGCRLGSLRRIVSVWDGSSAVLAARARLGCRFGLWCGFEAGARPAEARGAEGAVSRAKWH